MMSEDKTQNLADRQTFEKRVFSYFEAMDARFDAMDARFDAMDARLSAVEIRLDAMESRLSAVETRLDTMDSRLQKLEAESERRALETKPIWERALSQIEELRQGLDDFRVEVRDAFRDLTRRIGVLAGDMVQLRADQSHIETRLDKLETESQR